MSAHRIFLPPSSFEFLQLLKENNNRDWFNQNKEEFARQRAFVEDFAEHLLSELNIHDLIETQSGKKSLYRIYRDSRFSTDKTPYKTHWSGSFKRATKQRRGGYYFHLQPGNSYVAGGFMSPNPQDLKRIRDDISYDPKPLRTVLQDKVFRESFGALFGAQVKTTPKGFYASDDAIDLLRYKQFILKKRFTDQEVLSDSFIKQVNQSFKNMRPFIDYMSEVLSTDINGITL